MRHVGQVVTRTRLGGAVWQEDGETLANVVDVHISHLRRKIDREGSAPLIQTIRSRGYRLGLPET
jgi:two-component system OmpR family response regulator